MSNLVRRGEPEGTLSLHPNRIAIWPVESGGYGIDFTYHGATGYTSAEAADEIPRDGMRSVLDRFAW